MALRQDRKTKSWHLWGGVWLLCGALACAGATGCIDINDFIKIVYVPEPDPDDPQEPIDPNDPGDGNPTKPGGSTGLEGGEEKGNEEEQALLPLTLESLTPSSGTTHGGYEVRLRGTGFTSETQVQFGPLHPPRQTYVSGTILRSVVPASRARCIDITLTRGTDEATLKDGFCYVEAIEVTSVTPAVAVADTVTWVEITASGLDAKTSVYARVGETVRRLVDANLSADGRRIEGYLPALPPGAVDLLIASTIDHLEVTSAMQLLPPMAIETIFPRAIEAGTSLHLTIRGSGLNGETLAAFAGTSPAQILSKSESLITMSAPPLPEGQYDLVLLDAYRQVRVPDAIHYYVDSGTTQVLAVTPSIGPLTSQAVDIVGHRLPSSGESVHFGALQATVLDRQSSLWRVMAPAVTAPQQVDLTLQSADGLSALPNAYRYTTMPTGFELTPSHGPATGQTEVTLTGEGFLPSLRVFFDVFEAPGVQVHSATRATVTTPPGSGTAAIHLVQDGLKAPATLSYRYDDETACLALAPDQIPTIGGITMTIRGSGFASGMGVSIGETSIGSLDAEAPNYATFIAPRMEAGSYPVHLTLSGGDTIACPDLTVYVPNSIQSGASGGPIDKRLNVTVLQASSAKPIDGAVVYIGSDDSMRIGHTDNDGLVSFYDENLVGAQSIFACAPRHSCNSLQPVNARDITLYLEAWPDPHAVTPPP
ncbi:MAG: IPT/TIG domain-containing protein, partial [Proteobacteria bacterium]|nr:IPT/TIG domain-containing protein [Pseudomonadota bacterium]